jgi:hypothetical protein
MFTEPVKLDRRAAAFEPLLVYCASSQTFEDRSTEARDLTDGNVFHSVSGGLVKDSGDCVYFGMAEPFRFIQSRLSTAGAGGTLAFAYWNGSDWTTFTPVSGLTHLDSALDQIVLWQEYASIPLDWQKVVVDGQSRYWLRLEVQSSYSTAPIGNRITAIPELLGLNIGR